MDCDQVDRFIHCFLDDEFDPNDAFLVRDHVQDCTRCRTTLRFEKNFKEELNRSFPKITASDDLRKKVTQIVERESIGRKKRLRKRFLLRVGTALAAAGAAFVLGVVLWPRSASVSSERELAEQTIRWHRSEVPLDIADSQGEKIRHFFRDKVPFAVRLPRLKDPMARLVGARLTQLRGRQAVNLSYQVGSERVSFFVVNPELLGTKSRKLSGLRGYSVCTYVSDGTGYAVASEMNQEHLVRLIRFSE